MHVSKKSVTGINWFGFLGLISAMQDSFNSRLVVVCRR